jgi:hypothetical protein
MLLNGKVQLTLIEQLPKDKQAVLGQGDLALFPHFFKPLAPVNEGEDSPGLPLTLTRSIVIGPAKSGEPTSEVEVTITFSRELISMATFEDGNFLTIKVEDMRSLPEDWSAKEGNEKDLSSST